MIGILLLFILELLLGLCSVLFSVLAWRLKTNVMFWLGVTFTALLALIVALNAEYFFSRLIAFGEFELIILICFGVSIGCLIAAKQKPAYGAGTGVTDDYTGSNTGNNGPVTPEFLDEIINSPDEEIDYE